MAALIATCGRSNTRIRQQLRLRAEEIAAHAGPSTRRHFSHSPLCLATPVGHYDALNLPKNATKQQIKARFYELSKKHHPDAPSGSTAKFHEINDAYAILGDDSKRRQYDQTLQPSRPASYGHTYQPHSPHLRHNRSSSGPHASWGRPHHRHNASSGGGQTAGAGGHYNPFGRRAPPNYNTGPGSAYPGAGPGAAYARAGSEAFGGRTSTYGQRRRAGGANANEEDDHVAGESGLWRFGMVVGLLLAVVGFGGGLTASADTGDDGGEDTDEGEENEGEGNVGVKTSDSEGSEYRCI